MIQQCRLCDAEFDNDLHHNGEPRRRGPRRQFCSWEHQRAYWSSSEMQRKYALKRNYGITMEEYQALHEVQGGVCAICGQPETTVQGRTNTPFCLAVDHDHDTGKVRGLLCTPCNRGIGFLRDDPAILERALEYLNGSS